MLFSSLCCHRRAKRTLMDQASQHHLQKLGVLFSSKTRLFMFANVSICKSGCWALADWGPPEGLEEALFTCSEECCPVWTLLYLMGTQGHSAGRDGPLCLLPEVSTSQYQHDNTMWEKKREFLLMLQQCSETQVRCPFLPLKAQWWMTFCVSFSICMARTS